MVTVNVVDAVMGAGKTQSAINYMNENKDTKKFIYITPYLSEVERIENNCEFKQPVKYTEHTPKIQDLKRLLNNGENIVTTHAMFSLFDDEIIDICKAQNYILIMDEVHDVVEPLNIGANDLQMLLDNYVDVQDNGIMSWKEKYSTYNEAKYIHEKRLCDLGALAVYGGSVVMWLFPVKVFEAFAETYILTYMFDAQLQKYYYDYYGIQYRYIGITEDYHFTDTIINHAAKYNYKELINIYDDEKLNSIGDLNGSLSKTWYVRNKNNVVLKQLKNNLINFFNNKKVVWRDGVYINATSNDNIWTTFSDFRKQMSGKGYSKGFIPSNMRASNEWHNRTVVAYPVNKYFNPLIKNFFLGHNIDVNEDAYALSEMLQFVWRSGIRDGKHITIYVPSKRMRELLLSWIAANSNS